MFATLFLCLHHMQLYKGDKLSQADSNPLAPQPVANHIALLGGPARCKFFSTSGNSYMVESRRFTNSKEIFYGPVTLNKYNCVVWSDF